MNLWERNDPSAPVVRPIYFLTSDEDTVNNATEWAQVLSGQGSSGWAPTGHASQTEPIHGRSVDLFWTLIDRACHDTNRYRIPSQLVQGAESDKRNELWEAVLPFLRHVAATQDPATPSYPRPTFQTIVNPNNRDHDPFDWVLDRQSVDARRALLPGPLALAEDTAFVDAHAGSGVATAGVGTWLGHEGALAFDPSDRRIYVGSADGIVSRFRLADPPGTRLVLDGQAWIGSGRSLGYGIRGLTLYGNWLFASTHRRPYRFGKNSLATGPKKTVALDWSESRPGGLQVVNLWGGGPVLVYKTFYGELVARDAQSLALLARFSEPGIRDFVVSGSPSGGWSMPLYLMSHRGHIVAIRIQAPANPATVEAPAELVAASDKQEGEPLDLVRTSAGGIDALYTHRDWLTQTPIADTFREFDSALIMSYATLNVGNEAGGPAGETGWGSVGQLEEFAEGFLVLRGGTLHYIGPGATLPLGPPEYELTSSTVDSFPASHHPCAMAVGDVDGQDGDDVVLATQNGLVTWIPHADIVGGSLSLVTAALGTDPHAYSSAGIVATWGMTEVEGVAGIEVVDQTGRWWGIDANGVATFRHQLAARKPFRDLGYAGFDPPVDPTPWPFLERDVLNPVETLITLRSYVPTLDIGNGVFIDLPADWAPTGATVTWDPRSHRQLFATQFLPFHFGGDVYPREGTGPRHAYWWSGVQWLDVPTGPHYASLVHGVKHEAGAYEWWSSSRFLQMGTPDATPLRNIVRGDSGYDRQSLRLGMWPVQNRTTPHVVVGTVGGTVEVIDPLLGPDACLVFPTRDSDGYFQNEVDHGYGGMALAVADVLGQGGDPTIFFGTLHTHADDDAGNRDMVASLHVWAWNPGGAAAHKDYPLDGRDGVTVYGLSGIAVGEIDGQTAEPDGVDAELVLTTLDGDLIVYDLQAGGPAGVELGARLHWSVEDGALGACNAIVIADLDPAAAGNEVYVASTLGVRKFCWFTQ